MDRKLSLNRAETFSFVNPWIRYFLFFFSFLFWVSTVAPLRDFSLYRNVITQLSHSLSAPFILNVSKNTNHQLSGKL